MAVLHEVAEEDLARVVPPKTAALIVKARSGKLELKAGGGGTYGKLNRELKLTQFLLYFSFVRIKVISWMISSSLSGLPSTEM